MMPNCFLDESKGIKRALDRDCDGEVMERGHLSVIGRNHRGNDQLRHRKAIHDDATVRHCLALLFAE